MRSPKLAKGSSAWYRYYAGYSVEFVEDALEELELTPSKRVLDPWNGSGTTTAVSRSAGIEGVGLDANPALVVIARARLLGIESLDSLGPLAEDILRHAAEPTKLAAGPEPLATWFDDAAAKQTRAIEQAIRHVLVPRSNTEGRVSVLGLSSLAALFYVALFDAVRTHLRPFIGTNPTWLKSASADNRVVLPSGAVGDAFRDGVIELSRKLQPTTLKPAKQTTVDLASSTAMPLSDASVDAVVTSPPYCTRIDYVVSAKPELAVLGYSGKELRTLRDSMIGTPTITDIDREASSDWGVSANRLLTAVEGHTSRASSGYYRKYFAQYLGGMWESMVELRRVVREGGRCLIVVQDSYYKDVHVDLAAVVKEMGVSAGFNVMPQTDFQVDITKAAMNRGARSWRSSFSAVETVVRLA